MTTELSTLLGDTILRQLGSPCESLTDALKDKTSVLLYFSAHWCPPCRGFTPVLAEAYKQYKSSGGSEAEVVFISWDKTLSAFEGYFGEMPWLSVPFEGTEDLRQGLGKKFGVQGIPSLVALGPDGVQLFKDDDVDLRSLVSQHKGDAFPMTPAHVKHLNVEQEQKAKETLKQLRSAFPILRAPAGEETSFGQLLDTRDHIVLVLGDGDGSDKTYQSVVKAETGVNGEIAGAKTGPRLATIYLGWSLYNSECNHAQFEDRYYTATSDITEEFKGMLTSVCNGQVGAPHGVVLARDEDGSAILVGSHPGCQIICNYGAEGYPWSKERVAELEAAKKLRMEKLKEKQTNLEFLKGSDRDGLFRNDGTEVQIDSLLSGGSDAVVGLYFSAHWCPPCRGFTPHLAECYKELKEKAKPLEIVFLSSDKDEESFKEYFAEMPWLALPFSERNLKEDLSSIFDVQGIPTLVLLKPDGTLLTSNGREAISFGADYFPWGPDDISRGRVEAEKKAAEKKEAAIKNEAKALEEQTAKGGPVVKRLRGEPGVCYEHDVATMTLNTQNFPTLGAPEMLIKSGVLYYEIEVLESRGVPQIGFASSGFEFVDEYTGEGIGDCAHSWGFDGVRQAKWYDGSSPWTCEWHVGDVIGFAANVDIGKIAVSKNGVWSYRPNGVAFEDEKIKGGIYPAFTGSGYNFRYNLDGDKHGPFKHALPPHEIWAGAPQ